MMPRLAALLPPVLVLLALGARPAGADQRVPAIADSDLPVAGPCAPIETRDVTFVRPGVRTGLRWFAVSGVAQPVEYRGLVEVLKQRAGSAQPSTHGVWLTASAKHAWVHLMLVRQACIEAMIYRIGVRVRSEATGQVMGFPLFTPPTSKKKSEVKAGILRVRLDALHKSEVKGASDVGHLYAAARRAHEKRGEFGVQKITGNIRIAPNAPLQYALTAIDLLYRGGCAGVKVPHSLKMSFRGFDVIPVLEIQGGIASRHPQSLKPPALQPRRSHWGILGAGEPGWIDLETIELPKIDSGSTKPKPAPKVRPNYAARPTGVPADVLRDVDTEARRWAARLGADIFKGLRGGAELERRFTVGLRRIETLPAFIVPARKAFRDATRVVTATIQFTALLFNRGRLQGRADVTVAVGGDRLRVIFGKWRPAADAAGGTLVPFGVDPFAGGDGATFRIWFEGLFHSVKRQGKTALPRAGAEHVLPYLPRVAHAGTRASLARRDADLDEVAAQLGRATWDRVVISVRRGTATVVGGPKVVGILSFGLRAEEYELRLNDLKPRRAP